MIRKISQIPKSAAVITAVWSVLSLARCAGPGVRLEAPEAGSRVVPAAEVIRYPDGRPAARYRLDARDQGVVFRHGVGPGRCDILGARDIWVYEDGGTYYMNYDGAGPKGWLACLAVSRDLVHWEARGPVLDFGAAGEDDSASASYGVTYFDGRTWHMFYMGTPHVTPKPDFIPSFPYLTMKARGSSPAGPWTKQKDVIPFRTKAGTYYGDTASPGFIVKSDGEYLMFFSASMKRTLALARTKDLDGPWTIDPAPILPPEEQVENSSLYFEPENQTWFLFTNHVGLDKFEYTDSVWVYWSRDLRHWDPADKAIVLDGANCSWSRRCVGLPSVVKVGDRLAVLYDAPGGDSLSHMNRDIGLAWLNLPLRVPERRQDAAGAMAVWSVDPLIKVFRDDARGAGVEAGADVARGEVATLQIVARSDRPIARLRADVSPLIDAGRDRLKDPRIRFVGYVPVSQGLGNPPADRLRVPPASFPDPLLEEAAVDVDAGQAQPVWVTVPIPENAASGLYRGSVRLTGKIDGNRASADFPVSIRVHKAVIGKSRLWVDNWFFIRSTKGYPAPEPNSRAFWALARSIARDLAEHRQSVALLPVLNLARIDVDAAGKVHADFREFDRWVKIFIEEGVIGRIDGGGIGTRVGGWAGPYRALVKVLENGKIIDKTLPPEDPGVDAFYGQLLPQLVRHLKDQGWFESFLLQVADEPCDENADTFKALAAVVRRHAPGLKTMDACCGLKVSGSLDVYVPEIDFLHPHYEHYRGLQKSGAELWMYTCCHPEGEYANRFIELPLLKTRLLHWVNFRYGTTGYLHWGYDFWPADKDPYADAVTKDESSGFLPAGDAWIVYPGRKGPVDSIRFEAMRDGIADYELLCRLEEKESGGGQGLAAKHVLAFDKYDGGIDKFRRTRRELLERLSRD